MFSQRVNSYRSVFDQLLEMTTKSSTHQSQSNSQNFHNKQSQHYSNERTKDLSKVATMSRAKLSFSIDSLINKDAALAAAAAAVAVAAANHQQQQQQDSHHHNHHNHQHKLAKFGSHHNGSSSNGLMIRIDDSDNQRMQRHRQMMMGSFGQWHNSSEMTSPEHRVSSNRKRSLDSESVTITSKHRSHHHSKKNIEEDDDEIVNVDDVVDVESISSSHDDECASCRSGSMDRANSPNSSSFYDSMSSPLGK